MGNEYCQMADANMRKFVSPNRAGPIAQAATMMNRLFDEHAPMLGLSDQLLEKNTVKIQHDPTCHGQTAEIRDANAEAVATYNTFGGGWCPSQTKEEGKFHTETAAIYAKAFRSAQAAIKAEGKDSLAKLGGIVTLKLTKRLCSIEYSYLAIEKVRQKLGFFVCMRQIERDGDRRNPRTWTMDQEIIEIVGIE